MVQGSPPHLSSSLKSRSPPETTKAPRFHLHDTPRAASARWEAFVSEKICSTLPPRSTTPRGSQAPVEVLLTGLQLWVLSDSLGTGVLRHTFKGPKAWRTRVPLWVFACAFPVVRFLRHISNDPKARRTRVPLWVFAFAFPAVRFLRHISNDPKAWPPRVPLWVFACAFPAVKFLRHISNDPKVLRTRIACEYMHARFLRGGGRLAIFKRPESLAHARRLDGFHLMMIHVFLIHFG